MAVRSLILGALWLACAAALRAQTGAVGGRFVMFFHGCDRARTNCGDPRNHMVYLTQSDDGLAWSLIPGWSPFPGSVADVIRRGNTLYIYTASDEVARYHLDTGKLDAPVRTTIAGAGASLIPR